jgi:mandelamide amidase
MAKNKHSELSAVDAVWAMRDGSITAEDYALSLLDQCQRGSALNAFITLDPEQVLEAARLADKKRTSGAPLGPLHGLPIPIKDSINTKDLPTTCGTPALRNFRPRENAPIVQLLLDAGATVLGKTNLHELSMGWTSDNRTFGAVRNPYDLARIPGGSSGGTAAAVAARMAPLGVAEDTEGSIRVPAALCGIAGFRPTTGRYPSAGTAPISALFDQVGPHARTVADLALFDSVVTGNFEALPAKPLKGVKLGVVRDYWFAGLDPEVERITSGALEKLEDAGVVLVESTMADLAWLIQRITGIVQIHDLLQELPKYLSDFATGVSFQQVVEQASPDVKACFAEFVSEAVYAEARDIHLPKLRRNFRDYFRRTGVDAIVFPATMVPAPLIGNDVDVPIGSKKISFVTAIARNIAPGSTAGLPGLVLPSGLTKSGLPVSLELDAPSGEDRNLLALGLSVEAVMACAIRPKEPPRPL